MPFGSVDCCFDSVFGACFRENIGDVPGHGVDADEQLYGDFRVVSAQGNKGEHFSFSLSERMRECRKYRAIVWPVMVAAGLPFGLS